VHSLLLHCLLPYLVSYSLSYSISLLFLRRRCCARGLLRQATLQLVRDLCIRAATAFQAALRRQHLVYVAFALFTRLHVHEVEEGLDRVRADERDVELVALTPSSVL